ncbi:MAG TPA: sigma-70 family RNA polymerase sigma factor [Bryobacteraceae bacterium]|nr:sigma-70 family RNA polymerase sigma factor [Bryobacteraceae bacterium]
MAPDELIRENHAGAAPLLANAAVSRGALRIEEEVVALFDEFREPLGRYLLALGLPVPDTEEIIQETFLSLFEHLKKGKPRDRIRGWLFRVAHNLGLKRRNESRRMCGAARDANEIEELVADPSPGPEEQLSSREMGRRVRAVVRALSEQDRRCLYLRAEGLRYRELADVLDMSLAAVSISLARSLGRIARVTER